MIKKLLMAAAMAVGLTFTFAGVSSPASALTVTKPAVSEDHAGVTKVWHRRHWRHHHHHWRRHHHWRHHHFYRRHHYYPYYYGGYYPYYYGGYYPYSYYRPGFYISFGRGW